MIGISTENFFLFAMPILASRLGGMTLHIAVRRTARAAASRSGGPLFAHSRGPRRLLPENVEFHSSISRLGNSSKLDCIRLNEMVPINDACGSLSRAVRRRPTAADCCRTPTAVGEQHIPTNCAASRHYLRQSAQSSPPAAAHFSTKKDRPNTSGSLFSKNLNYKLAIL